MAKGYLIVNVYLENESYPVEGALVTISGDNYEKTFLTDIDGKTNMIELNAPEKEYSLVPQDEVRPYAVFDLKVTKKGLGSTIIKGVEILPEETSLQDVFMNTKGEVIDLPKHELWGEYEDKIQEEPIKDESELHRVLPRVIIPEYIIVHDGVPTNASAPQRIVPFIDYIKNVASSEIFSTWPLESLRANIHAIVSFTLNRVFTEWYRSRGYRFTITSSPAFDQKYTHNRTIFRTISDVVDDIFRYYIRLPGMIQPFFAQYNDGVKSNHPGRLSQWGSVDLANRGRTALQILRHYYTSTLTLEVAPEVIGLPVSFPGFNLNLNSCGEEVLTIQNRLNRIRTHYPGIPVISPANGIYNESTRSAVQTFQRVFNLPVTGVVNFATWFRISNIFIAVAGLQKGV